MNFTADLLVLALEIHEKPTYVGSILGLVKDITINTFISISCRQSICYKE
jgi:hypothetical protein